MAEELSAEQMLAEVNKDQEATTGSEAAKIESSPKEELKTQTATDPATGQTYKYVTTNGKEVSEPLDMILKRAGMGYHYAQQMHNLNQQMERMKGVEERNKSLSRWEEYDKYAQGNPEWAQHVQQAWDNRTNLQKTDQPDPYAEKFKSYEEKLADLQRFKDETMQVRTKEQYATQDRAFVDEIQTVGKTYGVDLDQADAQGRSLEWQVLAHMEKIGLNGSKPGHFTAAFKDYYFDNLMNRQKEQVKEGQTKSKAELKKAGILDISRTPKGQTTKGYSPGMDWNALGDMALAEIRAAKS